MKTKFLFMCLMLSAMLAFQSAYAGVTYCSETFISRPGGGFSSIYWNWNSVDFTGYPSTSCCDYMSWIEARVVDAASGLTLYYDYQYYGGAMPTCFYFDLPPSCCCANYYGGSINCYNL